MAHYGGNDYWENTNYDSDSQRPLYHAASAVSLMSNAPPLNHKGSSASVVSSMSSDDYYDAPTSFMSSPLSSYGNEQSDISHIHLSNIEGSGIPRPSSTSSSIRHISAGLPDTLRVGSPTSSIRDFSPFPRPSPRPFEHMVFDEGPRRPSPSGRSSSKKYSIRRPSLLSTRHDSIPENEENEDFDMGLLQNAMPMSFSPGYSGYRPVTEEIEHGDESGVDISFLTGPVNPATPKTEAEWSEIRKKERDGQLTGGLGAGWTPDTILTSTDLLASAPPVRRTPTISRRLSIRTPLASRVPTLRDLAQLRANKSGKIIGILREENEDDEPTATMDLSSMEGTRLGSRPNTTDFDQIQGLSGSKGPKRETILVKHEVFYPQANWKPHSMRWPYLTGLIVISVTLAAAQEYILQKSLKKPLYSFQKASDLKTWDYFCFKYMPTLVAVTFGILWQITDFEVKRLEAYYQLSKEGGALAGDSINVDYITFFNFLRPVRAFLYKHYAVAVSSLATLIAVSLVPTLQSASITLQPDRDVRKQNPNMVKEIRIDPIWSRVLSVLLLFIAVFGCVLVWQLQKRRSGLVADVKGIAGIAAMANKSHILMDFKGMDVVSPREIHHRLKKYRYTLRNSSLAPEPDNPLTHAEPSKYDQQKRPENPHPLMLRLPAGILFIAGMLMFMAVVPVILFQPGVNIVTEKAPWLLTVIAVGIKLVWSTLETDVRMMEPFFILSQRHASPKVLTLDYTAMAFAWMPVRAFMNGHILVALVGLGSVLAEVLTICMSSFGNISGSDFSDLKLPLRLMFRGSELDDNGSNYQNDGEETFLSFWISFLLSITILSFLCLVATFVYSRRRHPFLPRQPSTISSVLAFIHQSKMLYDFVDTEKMNNDEMVKRLVSIRKTYGLGWFSGRDGEMHCGVDEEELSSDYKHGQDGKKTNKPWNSNWQDY